jgi:hypothetical protein
MSDAPKTYDEIRAAMDHCATLEDDWDGYGGIPLAGATKASASAFIQQCEARGLRAPEVGYAGDGEIDFRWKREPDGFASVGFLDDHSLVGFARLPDTVVKAFAHDGPATEGSVLLAVNAIAEFEA